MDFSIADGEEEGNMPTKKGSKGSSPNRAARYLAYKQSGRREVNKALKLMRHIDRYGDNDVYLTTILKAIPLGMRDAAKRIQAHRKAVCNG